VLHVRFEGRSYEVGALDARLDAGMNDAQVRERVAQLLDVGIDRLTGYVVDRAPTGHVIVRPEAVYG
jgi:hypothetical protein